MTDLNGFTLFIIWLAAMYGAAGFGFWVGDYFQRRESEERKASWARAKAKKDNENT